MALLDLPGDLPLLIIDHCMPDLKLGICHPTADRYT
jgi:hypothetical protein